MTAADILARFPPPRCSGWGAYRLAVRASFRRSGALALPADYDAAGYCLLCGEAGRCPGWHTVDEADSAAPHLAAMTAEQIELELA